MFVCHDDFIPLTPDTLTDWKSYRTPSAFQRWYECPESRPVGWLPPAFPRFPHSYPNRVRPDLPGRRVRLDEMYFDATVLLTALGRVV